MLTSSFACTPSPASVAITSFAFMFDEVPEPVWKTSIGNWSSSSPSAIRSPAAAIRSALLGVEQPELGVHARGGGLDPAEPARDGRRDRLAGDREVVDRLARLAAPELLGSSAHPTSSRRAQPAGAAASSSSQVASFTRGRPCGSPRPRSCSSIASQPAYSTKSTPRSTQQLLEVALARARAARPRRPRAAARRSRPRPSCSCRSRRSGRA